MQGGGGGKPSGRPGRPALWGCRGRGVAKGRESASGREQNAEKVFSTTARHADFLSWCRGRGLSLSATLGFLCVPAETPCVGHVCRWFTINSTNKNTVRQQQVRLPPVCGFCLRPTFFSSSLSLSLSLAKSIALRTACMQNEVLRMVGQAGICGGGGGEWAGGIGGGRERRVAGRINRASNRGRPPLLLQTRERKYKNRWRAPKMNEKIGEGGEGGSNHVGGGGGGGRVSLSTLSALSLHSLSLSPPNFT